MGVRRLVPSLTQVREISAFSGSLLLLEVLGPKPPSASIMLIFIFFFLQFWGTDALIEVLASSSSRGRRQLPSWPSSLLNIGLIDAVAVGNAFFSITFILILFEIQVHLGRRVPRHEPVILSVNQFVLNIGLCSTYDLLRLAFQVAMALIAWLPLSLARETSFSSSAGSLAGIH